MCNFLCTVTDFSAAEKARGMKFCMLVQDRSSPILVNFGLEQLNTRSFGQFLHIAPGKRNLVYDRQVHKSHLGTKTCKEARWGFGIGCRGSAGHSELSVAACTEACQGIQNYARGSVGIRNWGRRRRLRPYGGICVLQTC